MLSLRGNESAYVLGNPDSKLAFETHFHLHEILSKASRNLSAVRRVGMLFDCKHVIQSWFNAYVLHNLEYCASVWLLSHLSFVDSVVRSAERLYEDEFCCLGHRRKVSGLFLLYRIYDTRDLPMYEYLHHFVAARNTRASAALGELALMILRCKTDQFSQPFLHTAVRLWNLQQAGGLVVAP